ncbi:Trk system potassium transporter TrkA [Rhodohalobacter halophilus]|uniref:Trk system potassium transporter TrkA n=1 Tax=Rhodohalobacter halophilus TaxID=1812810 RepID=UPI00083F5BEF|nr:Trk system potassium transporter TrkA [Rhodohalobacter halophilus]
MKILIAGAGEVGYELSKVLSEERHDVTVMDERQSCLQRVLENLDVLAVEGNATSPKALVRAGAHEADMMVACTSVDEVNIIACMMAKRLGVRSAIARVRNDELSQKDAPITPSELGIDVLIHPEESAATEIHQLIKRASASDIVPLAEGRMQLIGIRVEKNAGIIDKTLRELAVEYRNETYRIVAISRRGTTILPTGQSRIMPLDHIFVLSKTEGIEKLAAATGHEGEHIRNIMVAGGNEVGRILSKKLSADKQNWKIKLIEPDKEIAQELAGELRNVLVLHGDPTDPNLLAVEGIQEMDAFISVTEDEESNIISALMAKHLEVRKTVALVSKSQYLPLSQTIGIDSIVNVKAAATDEIHRNIRQGNLLTVKGLHGINAEIIEVEAGNNCEILERPLKKIQFPAGMIIGALVRNEDLEIATGDTVIKKGDRVILFVQPQAIKKVEELFHD